MIRGCLNWTIISSHLGQTMFQNLKQLKKNIAAKFTFFFVNFQSQVSSTFPTKIWFFLFRDTFSAFMSDISFCAVLLVISKLFGQMRIVFYITKLSFFGHVCEMLFDVSPFCGQICTFSAGQSLSCRFVGFMCDSCSYLAHFVGPIIPMRDLLADILSLLDISGYFLLDKTTVGYIWPYM